MLVNEESSLFLSRKTKLLRHSLREVSDDAPSSGHSTNMTSLAVVEGLLRSLLIRNPEERPTAREALCLVDNAIDAIKQALPVAVEAHQSTSPLARSNGDLMNDPSSANLRFLKGALVNGLSLQGATRMPSISSASGVSNEIPRYCKGVTIWPLPLHDIWSVLVASSEHVFSVDYLVNHFSSHKAAPPSESIIWRE